MDSRPLLRPAAGGDGGRAAGGRARTDARRRHRRARAAGDAVRIAAGRRQQRGRTGERPIAVRRYAAVLAPGAGEIGWAEVGADGPIAAGRDGRARRALAGAVVGRPRRVPRRRGASIVQRRRDAGAAAGRRSSTSWTWATTRWSRSRPPARAPMLAVVRAKDVMLLDTSSPLRPARSTPRALPPEIRARARRRRRPVARRQAARGRHRRRQPGRAARSGAARPRRRGGPAGDASRTFARACWSTSRSRRRATRCGSCRATRRAAAPAGRSRPSCARCAWARARRA